MTIKYWPKEDRPREKLMERGPSALTDAELLELFLGTGCNGLNALEQAQLLQSTQGKDGHDIFFRIESRGDPRY